MESLKNAHKAGDSFYRHEGRAATKEIRKLMHIQGEARGWTVSMVSIADRKTGTILHAAFPASLDPSLLTFASILCTRWFVGNHCQEGLTWAFLHESLYLRERARNINPGLVHEPTRPPVPQRGLRLNPMEHEDLNEGRVANWFRHELLSCGLIWQRVEGICRRFGWMTVERGFFLLLLG